MKHFYLLADELDHLISLTVDFRRKKNGVVNAIQWILFTGQRFKFAEIDRFVMITNHWLLISDDFQYSKSDQSWNKKEESK